MRNAKTLFVVLCIMLTHLGTAHAKLGAFEFEHMVKGSTFIVIGKVKSVSLRKNATVEVLEILKSAPGQELVLNVGKTWTCDVSEAKKGETILLFVSRNQKEKRNQIYASSRGRMPIDELKGKKYATFWPEVRMPKGIEVIKGPEPKWSFIRRANLGDLKKCIKKTLEESPNQAMDSDEK